VLIRDAQPADWPGIWSIIRPIVRASETFTYDPAMTASDARDLWLVQGSSRTTVAADDGEVVGTATMGPNRPGPGAHVATASFMVASERSGRGIGRALVEDALDWARGQGFRAMQFNAVAESNVRAVALYRSLGFEIVGTVPEAFLHPTVGYVGLHVMHRRL
jgi:L-amino acid N-acyltransferase YncA